MHKLLIGLSFLIVSFSSPEKVWNSSKTIGISPAENWLDQSKDDRLTLVLNSRLFKASLDVSTSSDNNWTLDELWDAYVIKGFPDLLLDFSKVDEGKINIKGREARWLECFHTDHDIRFKQLVVCFVAHGKLHIIICTALPEYYTEQKSNLWAMIKSIETKAKA